MKACNGGDPRYLVLKPGKQSSMTATSPISPFTLSLLALSREKRRAATTTIASLEAITTLETYVAQPIHDFVVSSKLVLKYLKEHL